MLLILDLSAEHSSSLKTKPGRGSTQSMEVQLLEFLNNSGCPNAYSTVFFLLKLSTIRQQEKELVG